MYMHDRRTAEEGPIPADEYGQMVWDIRSSILSKCMSKKSMLLSEKELKGHQENLNQLLSYNCGSKHRVAAILETLRVSGDLVPLTEFTDVEANIEKPELLRAGLWKTRKVLRNEEKMKARLGITPWSETKGFVIQKFNALLGRTMREKVFVGLRSLPKIAEATMYVVRKESPDLLDTRKGLFTREGLKYIYDMFIRDSFTRTRLHIYLTSRGLIKYLSFTGRPEILRVTNPRYGQPTEEDLEHFWLQMEKQHIYSEMHKRKAKLERDNYRRYIPTYIDDTLLEKWAWEDRCYTRYDVPAEVEKLSHVTDAELKDRLVEINSRTLHLDSKHYQEHPEDWERQIIRTFPHGKDRFTPHINLIHQIFSTASPVAPQLWNIYQFMNRAIRHKLLFDRSQGLFMNINSVDEYLRIFATKEDKTLSRFVNGICFHAIINYEAGNFLLVNPNPDNPSGNPADPVVNVPAPVNADPVNPGLANPNPVEQIDIDLAHYDPANPHLANLKLTSISIAIHIVANPPILHPDEPDMVVAPPLFVGSIFPSRIITRTTLAEIVHGIANLGLTDHGLHERDSYRAIPDDRWDDTLPKYVRSILYLADNSANNIQLDNQVPVTGSPASPGLDNPEAVDPELANPQVGNHEVMNPEPADPELANPDVANHEVMNADPADVELVNPEIANPALVNPNLGNPEQLNVDLANPGLVDLAIADMNIGE